jgi:hypothetical protein
VSANASADRWCWLTAAANPDPGARSGNAADRSHERRAIRRHRSASGNRAALHA